MYAPVGIDIKKEIKFWLGFMFLGTVWCVRYIFRYLQARENIYKLQGIQNRQKVLIEGVNIVPFAQLTEGLFEIFYLVIVFCIILAVYHYYYHYQGSRMMYLMRRLPNKWEVHIRCLFFPVAGSLIAVGYALLLKIICYAIYIFCTPSQCLPL